MAKIPRDREEDSFFCLQDDSRLPADTYIMLPEYWGMLQVPWSVVQIINQSSPVNSFSPSHACTFSWECCFVYSYGILCEGIATFPLSTMQSLDYALQVLCMVGVLAHQAVKSAAALPLSIPHRTRGRGRQRIQEQWLGRPYGPTQRPTMPWSQGRGRPGCIRWATAGSRSAFQGLPLLKSIREHGHEAHPTARTSPMHTSCHQDQKEDCRKTLPRPGTRPLPCRRSVSTSCLYSRDGKNQHQMVAILTTALLSQVSVSSYNQCTRHQLIFFCPFLFKYPHAGTQE